MWETWKELPLLSEITFLTVCSFTKSQSKMFREQKLTTDVLNALLNKFFEPLCYSRDTMRPQWLPGKTDKILIAAKLSSPMRREWFRGWYICANKTTKQPTWKIVEKRIHRFLEPAEGLLQSDALLVCLTLPNLEAVTFSFFIRSYAKQKFFFVHNHLRVGDIFFDCLYCENLN